jgi:hypothetical protein
MPLFGHYTQSHMTDFMLPHRQSYIAEITQQSPKIQIYDMYSVRVL